MILSLYLKLLLFDIQNLFDVILQIEMTYSAFSIRGSTYYFCDCSIIVLSQFAEDYEDFQHIRI